MASENETKNEKARRYAGQLISIRRKTQVLSVNDRLSHVDESADATYLELLHPAAVYRMSILGDIQKGLSAIANIRPEDVELLWLRLQFAEEKLFDKDAKQNTAPEGSSASNSAAFTVSFAMGRLKGKTPGGFLKESSDKNAAVKELRSQYDFLAQNVGKYSSNQKVMDAIKDAIEYYELGALDAEATSCLPSGDGYAYEASLYDPPEKTFRKDTVTLQDGRTLTKCYKIQIAFIPSNDYPYRVTINNRYAMIDKDPKSGLEKIRSVEQAVYEANKACQPLQYKMSLTSGEMVSVVSAMKENLQYYKSCVYTSMRAMDHKLQEANRKAWKPKP